VRRLLRQSETNKRYKAQYDPTTEFAVESANLAVAVLLNLNPEAKQALSLLWCLLFWRSGVIHPRALHPEGLSEPGPWYCSFSEEPTTSKVTAYKHITQSCDDRHSERMVPPVKKFDCYSWTADFVLRLASWSAGR
jgi:hypothetical protein